LLDVPGHEPRSAGPGGALRVDVQPELRGTPGQGRAHAPRLAPGGRGHRRARNTVQPRRSGRRRRSVSERIRASGSLIMEKFTTHTGIAAPLKRSNVDTDQIIPAVFLKRVTKTGFDDALFHAWRQ